MRSGLFLFAAALGVFAQDATFKTDVRQVLVPVVVTDAKGRHAAGLHASDFRIYEDGVPQDIASVTTEAASSLDDIGALGRASNARPQAAPRHTFVICVDTLHASAASAAQLREALRKLFEKEKPGEAQYVLAAIGGQLRILQPATSNPLAIELKLRSAGLEGALGANDGAALSAELGNLRRRMDDFCKRCACGARSKQNCESELDTLKQTVDAEAAQWRAPTNAMLDQLRSVVDELAKLPTGRTLIFVSEGFAVDPQREFYAVVASYLPNAPQFHLDMPPADSALHAVIEIAASRNVVIDAIDFRTGAVSASGGGGSMDASDSGATDSGYSMIGTNRPAAGSRRAGPMQSASDDRPGHAPIEESAALERLASATGGIHFHSSGDLAKQLGAAFADGREYYVVAYTPKNSARDGSFRAIRVELTKGNLTVRAKPGYWAQ